MTVWMTIAIIAFLAGMLLGIGGTGANALLVPILNLVSGLKLSKIVTAGILSSALLKPATAALYTRKKKLNFGVVRLLLLGSLPAAVIGTWVFSKILTSKVSQHSWDYAFAVLLSVCTAALILSIYKTSASASQHFEADDQIVTTETGKSFPLSTISRKVTIYTLGVFRLHRRTVAFDFSDIKSSRGSSGSGFTNMSGSRKAAVFILGIVSGFLFGLTSIGSGSLTVSFLSLIFPEMSSQELVSIDLLQAAPLAIFAAAGQLWFASPDLKLFFLLTLMGFPGMFCGWLLSRRLPSSILKIVIAAVIWIVSAEYAYKSGGVSMLALPVILLLVFMVLFRRKQILNRQEEKKTLALSAPRNGSL